MKRFIPFIFLLVFAPLAHADRLGGIKSGISILLSSQTSAVTLSSVSASYVGISSVSASTTTFGQPFHFASSGTVDGIIGLSTVTASSSTVVSETVSSTFAALNISTWNFNGTNVDLNNGALFYTNEQQVGLVISTASPLGAYSLTATSQTITLGAVQASSMTITITSSGTYACSSAYSLLYNGATEASNQTITSEVFRQNNTPGIISGTLLQSQTGVITTLTSSNRWPSFFQYTTTNTNDVLSLQISISATPSAGSIQAKEASVFCQRLY